MIVPSEHDTRCFVARYALPPYIEDATSENRCSHRIDGRQGSSPDRLSHQPCRLGLYANEIAACPDERMSDATRSEDPRG